MRIAIHFIAAAILALALPYVFATSGQVPKAAAANMAVVRAEFGLFNLPGSGKPAFVATRKVPLVPGQIYGWVVTVNPTQEEVSWREEFTLPGKPVTWGGPDPNASQTISSDRKTSVKEGKVVPDRGVIANTWTVAPGDPQGRYVIRVFIGNRLARTFEFDVK